MNLRFKLLHYWCYKKIPNGSGLTIPFLIGSEKYLNNTIISIKELLIGFSENETNYFTSIEFCGNINEYVIKLYTVEDLIYLKNYPNFGKLYIQDDILVNFNNLDEISLYFEQEYSKNIKKEEYSKMFGKWVKFISDDTKMINNFK